MTPEQAAAVALADRLDELTTPRIEWQIQTSDGTGIVAWFTRDDSIDPERDARRWLAERQRDQPDYFSGHKVERVETRGELATEAHKAAATIRTLLAALDAAQAAVTKWETTLSAVMPADFKDWHENSRAEWPEIAAWVIQNLREREAALTSLVQISEDGEGQENECPVCGAEPGQPCSGPDPSDPDGPLGVEYGRLVHRARQLPEAAAQAPTIPPIHGIHATFQWDGEKQHHVPQVLVSFEPVPANSPSDAPGWQHREQLVALLMKHRPQLESDSEGGDPV